MNQLNALRSVYDKVFEKLCGSAEFLENIFEHLNQLDDKEFLEKINTEKLNLNKSIYDAFNMFDNINSNFILFFIF